MEIKVRETYYHKLTNEPMFVLNQMAQPGSYLVRLTNYAEIIINDFELQEQPKA